jgi:hypothetical protein
MRPMRENSILLIYTPEKLIGLFQLMNASSTSLQLKKGHEFLFSNEQLITPVACAPRVVFYLILSYSAAILYV